MSVLLLGDENLSFAGCLLQQLRGEGLNPRLTVAVTLAAENNKPEVLERAEALRGLGFRVLFGAALRGDWKAETQPNQKYNEVIAVLPGLAFQGCPEFIAFGSPLFQLRLHHFLFAVAKTAKATAAPTARLRVLWPSQTLADGLGFKIPFPSIDFASLATFCLISRLPQQDTPLDLALYGSWQPMIHPHETIVNPKP